MALERVPHRHQHIEHGLGADVGLAALHHHRDARGELAGERLAGLGGLGHAHQQAAIERTRGAADLHHERHAGFLQRIARRQRGERLLVGRDRLEAAPHD